jgi:hypothetical protein
MGGTKVKPVTFISKTTTTIVMILTCTMATSFTKFRLFCHKFCFIRNTFFSLLRAKLFAGSLNHFAEALQDLLPDFYSPLLKRRTQSPAELTSVASSPYTALRRPWIYIGLELSAVRNSTNSRYFHNICHFAPLLCWTPVTYWITEDPGGDGECRYPVGKAGNLTWRHI